MIDINLFNNKNTLLYSFQSPVVPPKGELIWINDGSLFYTVKSIIYKLDTHRRRLIADIIVA